MSHDKDKQLKKKPIAEQVSALASFSQATSATSDEEYRLESVFLDQLRQQLNYEKELHEFQEQQDRHEMRKSTFDWLLKLTVGWLGVVVLLVAWTALSPSVADREKLVQLQNQIGTISAATNPLQATMLHAASPKYCPILFHLSDSVLVAFITSTTVAVLGLFLTAAKWLYSAPSTGRHTADSKNHRRHE